MHDNQAAIDTLRGLGVIWRHDDSSRVHAILTSGKHSDFYCNISKLIEDPLRLSEICSILLGNIPFRKPVRFIGQAMGSITIASELARLSGNRMAYTEKSGDEMVFTRFTLEPGETAVIVEDVTTSGSTSLRSIAACERAGAEVFPIIFTIVNRCGKEYISRTGEDLWNILAYAKVTGTEWEPPDCPLCTISTAKRPKAHWHEFRTARCAA